MAVTILGNSNSIARFSYVQYLKSSPDIALTNASIGDNSNVFLLDFLANHPTVAADYIVVETSVIDTQWSRMQRQSMQAAQAGLELFLTAVRRHSSARIVLLVLPVRSALMQDEPHWVEYMADDLAYRFGVDVLNVYRLLRPVLAHWSRDTTELEAAARRVLDAAGLPTKAWLDFLWQTGMRYPWSPLTALHRNLFVDELHPGDAIQALVADLLMAWFRDNRRVGQLASPALDAERLVVGAVPLPSALEPVQRRSRLLSREFQPLDAKHPLTYRAPPGFRAAGLMVNRGATHAILWLTGRTGATTAIDMRFGKTPFPFLVNIAPFVDDVGDGDFTISVEQAIGVLEGSYRYWDTAPSTRDPQAEVGTLLLVRRDWRETAAAPPAPSPPPVSIEQQSWATARARDFLRVVGAGAAAVEASSQQVVDQMLEGIIAGFDTADVPPAFQKARLRLVVGQFDAAMGHLREILADNPRDKRAQALSTSLATLKALLKR